MLLVLAVRPARVYAAEPSSEADLKVEADMLMADSRWGDAGPLYSKLYAMTHRSGYLWNAAVCKYQLAMAGKSSPDEAEALFKQYLGASDLADDDVKEAKRCIADLEKFKSEKAKQDSDTVIAEHPAAVPSPAATSVPGPVPEADAPPAPAPPPPSPAVTPRADEGGHGHVAAYVVGGLGAASIVVGAVYSGIARSKETSVAGAKMFSPSDDRLGETAHAMQYVMYAAGAAGLAIAGVIYYLTPETPNHSTSSALRPVISPGFAGAGFIGRF
jgi:hypothetical protein